MKSQLRKPVREKASYTEQYKQEALELWRSSGRSAAKVAAELGIRPPLLYRWAQLERTSNVAKSEPKSKRSVEALDEGSRKGVREAEKGSVLTIDSFAANGEHGQTCRDRCALNMEVHAIM